MRNDDDLLNDILARKLAPFDERFRDTTEHDRDLDHPTELGYCEMQLCGKDRVDAVKVIALSSGVKEAICASCDCTLSEYVQEARIEGAEMLSRRARAIALFKRAAAPALFVAAAILQQVVCQ